MGKERAGQDGEIQKRKRRMKVDIKIWKLDRMKLYGQVKRIKGYRK